MESKYDSLRRFLLHQPGREITLAFSQLEQILGFPLPKSARKFPAWWANENPDKTTHSHSQSWTTAGWTAHPDLGSERADFRREQAK
jgi:hypothetical protein